jgi:hypothetical protein
MKKIVNVKLNHWWQYLWPPNYRRKKKIEAFLNWHMNKPEQQETMRKAIEDQMLYGYSITETKEA